MEFISTKRGATKLCYDGFAYTKKKSSKTTITWECAQRRSLSCNGTVITDSLATVIQSSKPHNHAEDPFFLAAKKVREEIDESLKSNRGQPSQIIADKLVPLPVEVRVAAGTTETIKRAIRRKRTAGVPANPATAADIPIPLPESIQHVIYDNESKTSRVIVFGTDEGLGLLQDATTWFMDGTFSTSPVQFAQIFTIRVELGQTSATAAYALLPSKETEVYEECLTAILDACLQRNIRPNPARIVCDYEIGIHNAVKSAIDRNINVQGCFYHLTQSTWRHIQSEGLQGTYREVAEVRHFCGMLDGLAFLPPKDVKEGMRYLKEEAPEELTSVVDYFDRNYVSGGFRSVRTQTGALKLRRTTPLFNVDVWNVHAATMNNEARTNNICEAWNNGFKTLVGHSNPSLWTVIDAFRKDAALVEAEIYRVRLGVPSTRSCRQGTKKFQERLRSLCERRVTGDMTIVDFLRAIGGHIRLR